MVLICLLRLKLLSYWQRPLPLRVMVLLVTNSSWHTRFNLRRLLLSFPLITAANSSTYNRPFSISELSLALSSSSRAPGIDRIPYSFLHQLSHPQRLTLLCFFNYIFQTGYPSQWNVGIIFLILIPSLTTTDKYSYHPITLTDCLSKILGKMVKQEASGFPWAAGFLLPHSISKWFPCWRQYIW